MSNTIEFTGGCGATTTRMVLKREMERFGHVDVCHMGNRDNPKAEPPWVRFASSTAADAAVEAIQRGEIIVDGMTLTAQKSTRRGPPLVSREPRDAEVGSRELFMQRLRGGGGDRDRKRSRSRGRRSPSRGKRSDSRGKRKKSPSRGRRRKSSSSSSSRKRKKDKEKSKGKDKDKGRKRSSSS
mmetsp:Transcript_120760/g.327704  ORF Transcript_120760/g.327704 Transcript_120760/m.327704 type:complete len:183 (+) Transcript_120760:91-639(+)